MTRGDLERAQPGEDPTSPRVVVVGSGIAGLTAASAPVDEAARSAHLHVVVDTQSVEVFLDDGRTAMSMTVHPSPGEEHVRLHAVGGAARFTGLRLREH